MVLGPQKVEGITVKKRIAVFLDRDGTMVEDADYLDHADRLLILPKVGDAIRLLNENNMLAVMITNQSGVARGYFPESTVNEVHERLKKILAEDKAHLDGIYYCPHHPDVGLPEYRMDCSCRKPGTGMIEAAVRDLNIDLGRSYMVGDKVIDMEAAHNAGVPGVMVMTGYGREELKQLSSEQKSRPDHISDDLYDAVKWIISREGKL